MAEADIRGQRGISGVARDALSHSLYPSPRRPGKRSCWCIYDVPERCVDQFTTLKRPNHGQILDMVSISEGPATVEDRAIPDHWEGGWDFGSHNSQIATLVERLRRYVILVKVYGKDTETVINALIKNARKLPQELYKSLTCDRGKEMAAHKRFTLAPHIQVYVCDPLNPWQRGSNETTEGLLRQYLLKGLDLSTYSQAKLNEVARRLNERPRKTLDYERPAQRIQRSVAATG